MVGPSPSGDGPVLSLSENEMDVLKGAAAGETYAQTAARIFLTDKSAANVGLRVMAKLGARTMAQAVYLAVQMRILDPNRRHGDHAGFAAHRYYGEDPCDLCWEGERAYRRDRTAARKAANDTSNLPEIRTS